MNMIVLVTAASAPLAMPGLSALVAPQGNLIFVAHPSITGALMRKRRLKRGAINFVGIVEVNNNPGLVLSRSSQHASCLIDSANQL